ncbi:MAG: hypothetical protein O3A20_09185 [Planctomycetota bacterium]|nr:hypothetical protein [Planctomycetota bacterium]
MSGSLIGGYVLPNKPHPLLAPEQNAGWAELREAMEECGREIARSDADLLLIFSTRWTSIIGHQFQADPEPDWWEVDDDFHEYGTLRYKLRMDAPFAERWCAAARARGLHTRTVAYRGFPIDVGTVAALKLLNPDNRIPAGVVSCNMYSDRAETIVLGKATRDAVEQSGRKAIAVAVTSFSNRMFTEWIDPADDRIHSPKDDEWNRKFLELLGEGRLEDVSQLAREFTRQANGDSKMKALWWLAATMGQHNDYAGSVRAYAPIWGTGAAVVGLVPAPGRAGNLEYDEDDTDHYRGEREVLAQQPS